MSDRIIYKYPLEVARSQTIAMYLVHKLLCVQVQNGQPTLWAIVNKATKPLDVEIHCYATGNRSPDPDDTYIGTVQLEGFVWHYFEVQT